MYSQPAYFQAAPFVHTFVYFSMEIDLVFFFCFFNAKPLQDCSKGGTIFKWIPIVCTFSISLRWLWGGVRWEDCYAVLASEETKHAQFLWWGAEHSDWWGSYLVTSALSITMGGERRSEGFVDKGNSPVLLMKFNMILSTD